MIKQIKISVGKLILIFLSAGILIYSISEPLYTPTAIPVASNHYIFPDLIAHKSLISGNFPGNSFSAISEALASTIDGIEVDVRMSKDDILFLYHGDTLEEYTDHSGIPENYEWNKLSHVQYKNTKEGLVLLDDFFNMVGTQKVIFLDVKSNDYINNKIVKNIAGAIKRHNLQENVFVESFNPITLSLMRLYNRDIMLMYDFVDDSKALGEENQQQFNKIPWLLKQYWVQKQIRRIVRPDVLGPRFNINPEILKNLIKHGYPTISWTVNDPKTAKSLYEYGVKGLQSNNPQIIERIISKKNKKLFDAGGTEVLADRIISVFQSNDILQAIKKAKKEGKSLIAGGRRHSMGGQALLDKGIFLNMLTFNQVKYNIDRQTVTAQAGATWKKVQETLVKKGRSIKIMQSDNIFTVGGSVSSNVHGWQVSSPPIGSTIVSMTVITPDEKVRKISPNIEPELFKAVIGGYGMFAIIVDVEFITVPNSVVRFHAFITKPELLNSTFKHKITNNPNIELAYARLSVDQGNLFNEAGLFWYERQENQIHATKIEPENLIALKRSIFRLSEYSNLGKKFRWQAEKIYSSILDTNKKTMYRNDAMNTDIHILWPLYGHNIDILHEYFIPKEKINLFINVLNTQVIKHHINILNVTIREVKKDNISLLPYAKEDVFGLVCLFPQSQTTDDEEKMKLFTQSIINETIRLGGTFYLPYRLHYTADQILKAYPEIIKWVNTKRKYDPDLLLNSQFFHYIHTVIIEKNHLKT